MELIKTEKRLQKVNVRAYLLNGMTLDYASSVPEHETFMVGVQETGWVGSLTINEPDGVKKFLNLEHVVLMETKEVDR